MALKEKQELINEFESQCYKLSDEIKSRLLQLDLSDLKEKLKRDSDVFKIGMIVF